MADWPLVQRGHVRVNLVDEMPEATDRERGIVG
jgi:hypothetical protein